MSDVTGSVTGGEPTRRKRIKLGLTEAEAMETAIALEEWGYNYEALIKDLKEQLDEDYPSTVESTVVDPQDYGGEILTLGDIQQELSSAKANLKIVEKLDKRLAQTMRKAGWL